MKIPKPKAIDLGALQTEFNTCKKALLTDAKALSKAQDNLERSKKQFQVAEEALKAGSRAVLG